MSKTEIFTNDTDIVTTKQCNPWGEPLACPLIIYIVLAIISIFFSISSYSKIPNYDRNGNVINNSTKNSTFIIGLILNIIIIILFGYWMYTLCSKCQHLNAWLVFLLAIFFPIIISLIILALIGVALGVGFFVFR